MNKRTIINLFLLIALVASPTMSHARWLDPKNGRFHTMDTFEGNPEYPNTLHKYVYCADNPVMHVDPSGHMFGGVSEVLSTISVQLITHAPRIAVAAGYTALVAANVYIWSGVAIAVDDGFFDGSHSESLYIIRDGAGQVFFISAMVFDGATSISMTPVRDRGSRPVQDVKLSRVRYPEAAKHVEEARGAGHPVELTIERSQAAARRAAALKGVPRIKGTDRDEYPPAFTLEGGESSSVRHIDPSDNRGAGSSVGQQARQFPDGTAIRIVVTDDQ